MAGGQLRRYRGRFKFTPAAAAGAAGVRSAAISIGRAGRYPLPAWGGSLLVQRVREGGVPLALLMGAELREREGRELFQRAPKSTPRSLKKAYQSAGLAAWERAGPLLFAGGQLLFVPGLGIDARALAAPGVAQVRLSWLPDPGALPSAD